MIKRYELATGAKAIVEKAEGLWLGKWKNKEYHVLDANGSKIS